MARPKKIGLEYFPLDCQMDDKVEMLEAEHGLEGFAVYVKLLQAIYQTEAGELDMGVVFRWKTLAKAWGVTPEALGRIVDTMLQVSLFDKVAFDERQVLTSGGIQKRISKVGALRDRDRGRKSTENNSIPDGKPAENQRKSTQKERERESIEDTPAIAEPAAPSSADSGPGLPPVEPCHLTAQSGGKHPSKKAVDPGPAFDEFWDTFGKKEDKHKASKAWAALTADQRAAALAAVPSYVAGTPDKRYRKNPLTWLNGKCWLDEETPASRQVVAATPQPAPQLAPPAPPPAINHAFIAQQEAAAAAATAAHLAKFSKPQPVCQPLSQTPA